MACCVHSFRIVRPDGQPRRVETWMFHPGCEDEDFVASVWHENAAGGRDDSRDAESYSMARTKPQAEWLARQAAVRQWAFDADPRLVPGGAR